MTRDRTEFGQYLVDAINSAEMSQSAFIAEVGLSRPYFYDMLKGSPPPLDTLEKILTVLDRHLPLDEKRRFVFMDLAAKCRGEIPADIYDLIKARPQEWGQIRDFLTQNHSVQE